MSRGIRTHKLTKFYGSTQTAALTDLSIAIEPGEIYGFLGANGAGKSTTIRLLLNFLQPSAGTATINDLDSVRDAVEVKRHIGYLSGDVALYPKATGAELLDYMGSFYKTSDYRKTLEGRFHPDLSKPLGELSKGNRQKVALIQAFMHRPTAIILDEPTSGLDPLMQEAFYETLRENQQQGASILMSSHNLTEAQHICNRIGIIRQGILVHEQTLDGGTVLAASVFEVTFAKPAQLRECLKSSAVELVSQTDKHTAIFTPKHDIASALKAFGSYDIAAIISRPPDLEDEFLEYYGDKS